MNKKFIITVLLLGLIAAVASARGRKKNRQEINSKDKIITVEGVVGFTEIEGGCWHITGRINNSGDVERFELTGIDKGRLAELKGMIAIVTGRIREDMASVCQIGRILEIDKISPAVKPGNTADNNEEISAVETQEGNFSYFEGNVTIKDPKSNKWEKVTDSTKLTKGSKIKLDSGAYAAVKTDAGSQLDLNEDTAFKYNHGTAGENIKLYWDAIKAKVDGLAGEDMKIRTPVAVAAVRGTMFAVLYEEKDISDVEVYDGKVAVAARGKEAEDEITVDKDNWAKVKAGQKPAGQGKIPETRKLRWKHLKNKKELFCNLRKLKFQIAAETRLKYKLKNVKNKKDRELISKKLQTISDNRKETAETIKVNKKKIKKLAAQYKKLRNQNIKARQEFINRKRKEIIRGRMEKRRKKLKERKERPQRRR